MPEIVEQGRSRSLPFLAPFSSALAYNIGSVLDVPNSG